MTLGAQAGPLAAGRAARSELARVRAAANTKTSKSAAGRGPADAAISWAGRERADLYKGNVFVQRAEVEAWTAPRAPGEPKVEVREVRRPAPRFHVPLEPLVAVRGAKRSLRHGNDGRFSPDGRLQCRWPSQVPTRVEGVADGAALIRSLPSGGIPPEVILLARSAIVQDPYLARWLAEVESKRLQLDPGLVFERLNAEAAFRFGREGVYDGGTVALAAQSSPLIRAQVADELRRFSLVKGVDADPVGVTAWSQPWVPLWLEWELSVEASDRLEGWRLAQVDLETVEDGDDPPEPPSRTMTGRSPLTTGAARTLGAAIAEWLKAEEQRDRDNTGEVDDPTAAALDRLGDAIEHLDVVSALLDGVHERLLGLPVDDFGVLRRRVGSGTTLEKPVPSGVPQLLLAGRIPAAARPHRRCVRTNARRARRRHAAFPRARSSPGRRRRCGCARACCVRARWLFRLVDPADLTATAREATIDQLDATQMVNPVAGFILPDHIDEALELFDVAGQPLGQLMHEAVRGRRDVGDRARARKVLSMRVRSTV